MTDPLTRRRFFCALDAAAIAANVPLPIGFPKQSFTVDYTPTNNEGVWYLYKRTEAGDIIKLKRGETYQFELKIYRHA